MREVQHCIERRAVLRFDIEDAVVVASLPGPSPREQLMEYGTGPILEFRSYSLSDILSYSFRILEQGCDISHVVNEIV